ncbi:MULTISPECIES: Arc family DNA-binding protein [unclassified Pseudomonas]|uniref:Arc family DNA-binding protein n=1 Tax=unclassified Pseudomonas TaxID=196821 RepID=UPI000C86DB9B|nr:MULTISPECIES: Arc family DNA-binding protein [unclassified Pseudomonas]PMV89758.1 DNA-binding protein [Pseudomonas sp. GW460-C8]PMW09443.1 DNA-binding protein [Pseudomonas sp. GW456-11-11-14-TSB2]PMW11112.1 DNA-binding protein [Pseudomonas sp. GW456-E6]PMW27458.1 DNA-binding protein [Pseudomonas sp. GW460-7]PMW27547.1 DNA-binding protein [Pseudomonas sp. FW305-3-2-15-A-R2A1]
MSTSSRDADKFVVRLPDGMRDQINEVAAKNHRSMNSEIIKRMERTLLEDATGILNVDLMDQLSNRCKELEARLEQLQDQPTVSLLKRALEQVTRRCEELEARAPGAQLKIAARG